MDIEPKLWGLPRRQLQRGLVAALVWGAAVYAFRLSDFGETTDYLLASRLEFAVRERLGRAPELDKRLKIFGYDDQAVAEFQDPEIGAADWTKLFEAMGQRKPRAIVVDKMFSFFEKRDDGHVDALKETLARHPLVSVGAFVHNSTIRFHTPLNLERRDFHLDEMTEHRLGAAHWLVTRNPNVYGPHTQVRGSFRHIGHILYPANGRIDPLIRVSDNTAVPHLTLLAAGKLRVTEAGLLLDGKVVPLDDRHRLPVNFSRPERYFEATFSMKRTLAAARAGAPLTQIDEGDTVLVLPLLYTGNHDVVDAPVGRIPGGFVLAGLLSSALKDDWLRPLNIAGPLTFVAAFAGVAIGLLLSQVTFWPAFVGTGVAILGLGLGLFSYAGIVLPWLFPLVAYFGAGLSGHALTMAASAGETRRLKDALKGAVPEAKLKAILAGRGRIQLEASERIVTLMFVDIANFSVVAEQNPPKQVFLQLKTILRDVTKTIHKYGGTVDKTLGDGILCFFGYSYDGEVTENQADQAIRCAIEIQVENLKRCIEAARLGVPILPFRIGINTGSVYIGDIGNEDRIDFTVIGNGVNYAQRLESACEHHSLMMSGTTMDFSAIFSPKMPGFTKRYIHIKHHEELLEAIEHNPFHDRPEMREMALQEFRKSFNLERKEQRWPVDDPSRLEIGTDFGSGTLVDFSGSGCCVALGSYLSKGVTFTMRLGSPDPFVAEQVVQLGLSVIKAEVRWGKSGPQGFIHGLKFTNLTELQLEAFFGLLRNTFSRQKEQAG